LPTIEKKQKYSDEKNFIFEMKKTRNSWFLLRYQS